jgi:hypothetical protein
MQMRASSSSSSHGMDTLNSTAGVVLSTTILASTDDPPLGGNTSEDVSVVHQVCFLVMYYATSLIAPFGIIGNVFSITVFLSAANFRRTSTAQYLIALAATDSLYLVGELIYTVSTPDPWGNFMTSIDFVYTTDIGCKSVMWLRYRFLSIRHSLTCVVCVNLFCLYVTSMQRLNFASSS